MKIEYEKVEVSSKEEYEKLHFKCQGRCDKFCWVYQIVMAIYIFILILLVYIKNFDKFIVLGFITGWVIRDIPFIILLDRQWHYVTDRNLPNAKNESKLLSYWLAMLCATLALTYIIGGITYFLPGIFYYRNTGVWLYLVEAVINFLVAIIMCFMLHYLLQYFRWYRWTWEELQLSPKERKAQYKVTKFAEKQKRKEEREAKRLAAANARAAKAAKAAGSGKVRQNFNNAAGRSSAVTGMTQADRRSELENLKKLYEDGLIDEEEYKKAREKALGIK